MNEKLDIEILINLVFDKNSVEQHLRGAACDMARIEILLNAGTPEDKNTKELHQEKYEMVRKVLFETASTELLKILSPAEVKELIKIHENPLVQRFLANNQQIGNVCMEAISKKVDEHLQKLRLLLQATDSADFDTIN